MRVLRVAGVVVMASWLLCASAAAEPGRGAGGEDPARVATELFERAVLLAEMGAWEEALLFYQRSYDAKPARYTLYSMGVAELRLRRLVGARKSFEAFLEGSTDAEEKAFREAAEIALAAIDRRVARVSVKASPADARVALDGRPIDGGTVIDVDPGPHTVHVSHRGFTSRAMSISLQEGERRDVDIALDPRSGHSPSPDATVPIVIMSTAGGVLTAAALIGTTAWLDAPDRATVVRSTAFEERVLAAEVLAGVGAAALAAGAAWLALELILDDDEDDDQLVSAFIGPDVAGLELRWPLP